MVLLPSAPGTTLSRITPGRIKASVFEVDPRVLSRNAPETLASRSILLSRLHCGGEVTATGKIGHTRHSIRAPHAINPEWSLAGSNPDSDIRIGSDKSA